MTESDKHTEARILVIDDETGIREGCRRALALQGHVVDTATRLAEGREALEREKYDLFLLDVMLPDGSGLDLIGPILEQDSLAICIIIIGFGSIELAIKAVRLGAYDFLSKPFSADELIVAVEQGLERRRLTAIAVQEDELARAKRELQKLDEARSQLMLRIAHELRAPIAAVQSYINLILAGYMREDEIEPALQRVQERLQGLLDQTSDLIELARLKQVGEETSVLACPQPMADVLEAVLEEFHEQVRDREQILEVEIRDRPMVTARRDQLEQGWTNLISNAIKYTPKGECISVTL